MKTKFAAVLLALTLVTFGVMPAVAQSGYAKVKGKVTDQNGQPIVDATVDLLSMTNGQKQHLKTDKKGEYYSIGITPGTYKITFSKDGKQFWVIDNYNMSLQKEDS